jgi:hypothetical protein
VPPPLSLSADYLYFADPVTVTYAVKTAENTWAAGASVPYVQREAPTRNDFAKSPALLQKTSVAFDLWTANLGGIVPVMGDQITDNTGTVWFVERVDACDRDVSGVQRYHCACSQLVT